MRFPEEQAHDRFMQYILISLDTVSPGGTMMEYSTQTIKFCLCTQSTCWKIVPRRTTTSRLSGSVFRIASRSEKREPTADSITTSPPTTSSRRSWPRRGVSGCAWENRFSPKNEKGFRESFPVSSPPRQMYAKCAMIWPFSNPASRIATSYSFLPATVSACILSCFSFHAASHSSRSRRAAASHSSRARRAAASASSRRWRIWLLARDSISWLGSTPSHTMKPRRVSSGTVPKASSKALGNGRPFRLSCWARPLSSPTRSALWSVWDLQPSSMASRCRASAARSSSPMLRVLRSLQTRDQLGSSTSPRSAAMPEGLAARKARREACAGPSMPSSHFAGWQSR
mmetsp:Transcript_19751/g.55688  ORF Transcript_19751/g.55688 Transcript_19751/m.55688 type:complete len:342 (+) Transcript_19751:219-1244(+)